jgi:tricorn protease
VDVENGTPVRIDSDFYHHETLWLGIEAPPPTWSPDSRCLAFAKMLTSHMRALHIYSLQKGQSRQVTDGISDIRSSQFDRSGKYIYSAASTDIGPTLGGDLSTYFRILRASHLSAEAGSGLGNETVAPDIEVEQDPTAVRAGDDPQLEKAIEVVMELLKKNPPTAIKRPPYKRLQ